MGRNRILELKNRPGIAAAASAVGSAEREGPLAGCFDVEYPDDGIGSKSWEAAEASLVHEALETVLMKSGIVAEDVDLLFGGDLLNQCTPTTFGIKKFGIPYAGIFGACSTFALGLCLGALAVDGGYMQHCIAMASSHFCSAEKQFRSPLEYGGQRSPTAQRTVTGAGACMITAERHPITIRSIMFGEVKDYNITDASNMGAAMAPAAYDTLSEFMRCTQTRPTDYDMILTGDLGKIGSEMLGWLFKENEGIDISRVHRDCGNMIFDESRTDVHAGGSGCGCSAVVFCAKIFRDLISGKLGNVLFAGTGALMSPLTSMQKETIPGIAHAVLLSSEV